jgi:tetratricopeptide (TPR) repeat protein
MTQAARKSQVWKWLPAACLSLGLAGCLQGLMPSHWVRTGPASNPWTSLPPADPSDYDLALQAIDRGDYATALSTLQIARAHAPDDVRILNAFGVVYDKLGRFDLSARYYAQALKGAPNSEIILSNQKYSSALKNQSEFISEAISKESTKIRQNENEIIKTERPKDHSDTQLKADYKIAYGKGVNIINSSGNQDRAELLRQRLQSLGWSVPESLADPAPAARKTTIIYPRGRRIVAQVLAITLYGRPALVDCLNRCSTISLTLGSDTDGWPLRPRGPINDRAGLS